jgi:hypothetical protein
MADNDNDRFSDAERSLLNFINAVRPESKLLMLSLDSVSEWLWMGKMSVLGCFLMVTELAVLCNFQWWQFAIVLAAAGIPIYMIEKLELLLGSRWKARLKLWQPAPTIVWHLHSITPSA